MKTVGILVSTTPKRSETFIERVIVPLLQHEAFYCKILVFGEIGNLRAAISEKYAQSLQDPSRTIVIKEFRKNKASDYLNAVVLLTKSLITSPVFTFKAINPIRWGRDGYGLKVLSLAQALMSLEQFDIVHAQYLNLGIIMAKVQCLDVQPKAKLLVAVRGNDIAARNRDRKSDLCLLAEKNAILLPVSASLRDEAVNYGYPLNKINILRSGLDVDSFKFLPPKQMTGDVLRLMCVGRLVEKKGVEILIRALAKIPLDFTCSIYGDGCLKTDLVRLVKRMGLNETVLFCGDTPQEELKKALHENDLLIVPSVTAKNGDKEGIPNVIKEAMLSGAIVIGSDHSGIPELITEGQTGYIFKEGDPSALAAAIMRAVNSSSTWEQIAVKARKQIEDVYDIREIVQQLSAAYVTITQGQEIRNDNRLSGE